jgi:hypothetical protein
MAAVAVLREIGEAGEALPNAQLSQALVERVLAVCATLPPDEAGQLVALLRRYEAEAVREAARQAAGVLVTEAAALALEYQPEVIELTPDDLRSAA